MKLLVERKYILIFIIILIQLWPSYLSLTITDTQAVYLTDLIEEIKKSKHPLTSAIPSPQEKTQTTAHLNAMFNPGAEDHKNVNPFVENALTAYLIGHDDNKNALSAISPTLTIEYLNKIKQISFMHSIKFDKNSLDAFYALSYILVLQEKQYGNFFVLYHATLPPMGMVLDFFSELYKWLYIESNKNETYILRPLTLYSQFIAKDISTYKKIIDFKTATIDDLSSLITAQSDKLDTDNKNNDHSVEFKDNGIAANLSLFGSFSNPGESTLSYMLVAGAIEPELQKFDSVCEKFITNPLKNKFKIDQALLKKIIDDLKQIYSTSPISNKRRLYQIFIIKEKIDEIAYASRSYGKILPYNLKDLLTKYIDNFGDYSKTLHSNKLLQDSMLSSWNLVSDQKNKTDHLFYSFMLDAVQARVLLTPQFFANPENCKVFVYFWPSEKNIDTAYDNFKKELKNICKNLVQEIIKANVNTQNIDPTLLETPLGEFISKQAKQELEKKESLDKLRTNLGILKISLASLKTKLSSLQGKLFVLNNSLKQKKETPNVKK